MIEPNKTAVFAAEDVRAHVLGTGREHAVLVVLEGRRTSRRYEIKKPEYTVGRDDTCDLVLHDTNCSRVHAKFCFNNFDDCETRPKITLTDLQSTNGAFVNGNRVESAELKSGDKILVGKTLIGFFVWDDLTLKAEDSLLRSASTDGLTGLYNRGFFNHALTREFNRAVRYKRLLSLVLVDLDHFKQLNDAHGHTAGDRVLREIATLITNGSRGNDFVCRYGGEEIAILQPETALPGSMVHAQRLCTAIRALTIDHQGKQLHVSASFGIAEYEEWMRDPDHLLRAADSALYRAKREGRDCVFSHEGYTEEAAVTEPLQG